MSPRLSLADLVTGGTSMSAPLIAGSCGDSYLCTARPGYDVPTGVGAPRGVRGLRAREEARLGLEEACLRDRVQPSVRLP
ncbi:hypothetical protein [Nonomuraea lactucae]|uniref:hypothetical protein n=1 Tax=Nonomuraea lactucae TaxID=2249762 RepID=UPI0013B40EFB|nr:hypothetical protein [Nonomuraea lactucae]